MKQNISTVNALCRITMGLTVVAWSTAKLTKKQSSSFPLFATIAGAMKVAEGITKFCPLVYLAEQNQQNNQNNSTNQNQENSQVTSEHSAQ
ncbi:DUF2892 domain-containing protein [Bacillus sp. JCM 19034]|uniref:YgaP family membrane protein n=1 Tax=Bacillus sp. JCM 19034 TaxID=1481928 RepID=UPI000ADEA521|nr:DUF2892 domain-containing protein [Bacillus sp. JCM 19034]